MLITSTLFFYASPNKNYLNVRSVSFNFLLVFFFCWLSSVSVIFSRRLVVSKMQRCRFQLFRMIPFRIYVIYIGTHISYFYLDEGPKNLNLAKNFFSSRGIYVYFFFFSILYVNYIILSYIY